jgi:hypothetical protein
VSEVILFNHIPKTAGTTMNRVLWRAVGRDRVLASYPTRPERLAEIRRELDRCLDRRHAVASHIGCGIEKRLPERHSYPAFTLLRDPLERTLSRYWHYRAPKQPQQGRDRFPPGLSLEEFLDASPRVSFNAQTGFLGGLWAGYHLDDAPVTREQFGPDLLARAKRSLESHAVVGLTERFDETLLLLGAAFGWPRRKMFYIPANIGSSGRGSAKLTPGERDALLASNRLDLELYEFGRELFEARLEEGVPPGALASFRRLNRAYAGAYPATSRARGLIASVGPSR